MSLENRSNLLITNVRPRCAHYIDCRAQGAIWQPGTQANEVPEFTNCVFTSCSFRELFDDATIVFHGKISFYNCEFKDTHKIQIDSDCEFYNCSNINIVFAEEKEYNLTVIGSNVTFPEITSNSLVNRHPLNLNMTGGKLLIPPANAYSDWNLNLTNVKVTATLPQCIQTSLCMTNCQFQGVDEIYFKSVIGSVLRFEGTPDEKIRIRGGVFIGNVIENGTDEAHSLNTKTGVTLNAEISVGNRVNMAKRTMESGSETKTCEHNYNGVEVI